MFVENREDLLERGRLVGLFHRRQLAGEARGGRFEDLAFGIGLFRLIIGAEQVAEDGVHFNLQFDAYRDALPAWRFPDMTDHVEYLAQVVQLTIEQEMRKEAGYLRGLRNAEMIVLAARPSMGKTSLAMNICENVALGTNAGGKARLREPLPVGIFSCEMSTDALISRMLCSRARVSLQRVMAGLVNKADATMQLTRAASDLMNAPIYVDDTGGLARSNRTRQASPVCFSSSLIAWVL